MTNTLRYIPAFLAVLLTVPVSALAYLSPGRPTGFVNDFAGVVDASKKAALEMQLSEFQKQTGVEIAVVTVTSLSEDTIENFAVELFEEWGIGGAEKDTGILLLLAPNEREVRIEVGYGVEGALTDLQASQIISSVMTPFFRNGDFGGGLTVGAQAIMQTVNTGEFTPENVLPAGFLGQLLPFILFGGFIFLQVAVAAMAASKSWWAGGVFGGVAAGVFSLIAGFLYSGLIAFAILVPLGLILDRYLSKNYAQAIAAGQKPWWMRGGHHGIWFGGRGGGGGFGGFGGGSSGGGGASGRF